MPMAGGRRRLFRAGHAALLTFAWEVDPTVMGAPLFGQEADLAWLASPWVGQVGESRLFKNAKGFASNG